MKQFLRRLAGSIVPGGSTKHLIRIAELLDAPTEQTQEMARLRFEECEASFLNFIRGRHGCVVDWRANREEIIEELAGCASPDEIELIRSLEFSSSKLSSKTLVALTHALDRTANARSLIPMESFGDAAIVLLVPRALATRCKELANGWLIE